MASDVGPDPSYTIPYGPLTTLWTPHSSCLFTITSYSGSYYQGYIPSLGVDPACYPPSNAAATTSVIVTSTPQSEPSLSTSRPIPDTTTGVVPRDLVNAVNLYSPGICPSGWTYALSYVTTAVVAASASTFFNDSFLTAPTSSYTYFCCPDGFQLGILTPGPSPTIQVDYASCTSTDTIIEAVWDMKSSEGWPTSKPSDIQVYTAELAYEPDGCSVFTVTASGIAVAWAATDTAVIDYLQDNFNDAELWELPPEWPPEWPLDTPRPSCVNGIGGSPTWLLPVILSTVFAGGALCLWGCCIFWVMRRKGVYKTMLRPKIGASWQRQQADGENMPLTDIHPANLAEHTTYPYSEQAQEVESIDEEGPPSYNEALAMGNENLDATNAGMLGEVMRASHIGGELER